MPPTVGSILLSVNPFKPISSYGPEAIDKYAKADVIAIKDGTLAPHIYAVAKDAFEQMLRDGKSQSVIISGESGAGKTEATKYVVKYLTAVSGQVAQKHRHSVAEDPMSAMSPIERMILQSSPILEAFGNAKTVRNNNSSRFGKYFEIQFSASGEITGGIITDYLLEKSRVTSAAQDERCYHIFYLLCKGASPEERSKYKIPEDLRAFRYLWQSKCYDIEGVDEVAEYKEVLKSFVDCKVSNLEVDAIKRILSAILNLGNVEFVAPDEDDPCEVSGDSKEALESVASLMEFSEAGLTNALVQRTMAAGGRGSVYKIKLKKSEAVAARDALAKHMYLQLFTWLVRKISDNMSASKPPAFTIGVLDIFGFEIMPVNSFEQICINYANEKLHQQFIHYVFALEMDEYDKEKLGIKIDYEDNAGCVELIEKKGNGLLAILQEQCQLGARGSDAEFYNNANQTYKTNKYFVEEKRSRTEFSIAHYANNVKYETDGFIAKNRDTVGDDIKVLMDSTTMPEIKGILKKAEPEAAGGAGGRPGRGGPRKRAVETVANKFKTSLQTLVSVIDKTTPHYVRCLKSTETKQAGVFDGANMNRQLGYSGVLETIKVRLAGYAVRMTYESFAKRFKLLVPSKLSTDYKEAAQEILKKSNVDPADTKNVALGVTKVFLKREAILLQLEKAREAFMLDSVIIIQKYWRREYCRRKFEKMKLEAERKKEEERKRKAEEEERKKKEAEAAARLVSNNNQADASADEGTDRDRAGSQQLNAINQSAALQQGASTTTFLNLKARTMIIPFLPLVSHHRATTVEGDLLDVPVEPVVIKGWLAKEGSKGFTTGRFNNWNKRFFVMKKDRIVYYANDSLKDKKGDFQLDATSSVSEIPEMYHKNLPTGVGNNFFQLTIKGRSTKLACDHETDKARWMNGISVSVKQIQSKSSGGEKKVDQSFSCNVNLPDRSVLTTKVKTSNAKDVFLKLAYAVGINKGMQFFSLVKQYFTPDRLEFYNVFSERDSVEDLGAYTLAFLKVITIKSKMDFDDQKMLVVDYSQSVRINLMFSDLDEKDAIELGALQFKVKEGTKEQALAHANTHARTHARKQAFAHPPMHAQTPSTPLLLTLHAHALWHSLREHRQRQAHARVSQGHHPRVHPGHAFAAARGRQGKDG